MNTREQISADIRALRHRKGLSQIELARRTGRAQARISDVEKSGQDPRISTVISIADALDAELMVIPRSVIQQVRHLIIQEIPPSFRPFEGSSATDVYDELFVPSVSEEEEEEEGGEEHNRGPKK